MPLLSGPAPPSHDSSRADISCRKCNKEFNIIFTRARKCNHCGYSYCSSCSDYQALLPREGSGAGYDPVPVCAFCIENLTITAGGRTYLRSLSLARLKKYVDAYNIKTDGVLEKDDLIEKIIAARGHNGCLPYSNESFYRKNSVPNGRTGRPRGLFSRRDETRPVQPTPSRQPSNNTSSNFPRPDLDPSRQQGSFPAPRRTTPRPQAPPPSQPYPPPRSTPPPMAAPRPQRTPSSNASPPHPRPNTVHPTPGYDAMPGNDNRTNPIYRSASAAPPPPPPPPQYPPSTNFSHMSISVLKNVLFQNHVNARLLLEKSDLVARVCALLGDERQERAREAAIHAREEDEIIARQHAMMEEQRLREEQARQEREHAQADGNTQASESDTRQFEPKDPPRPMMGTSLNLDRNGLCVVCQDEEANIAIVDCGHLAMCRNCSDLIMSSSRECPLCRTRIVTEARLLRIFKT
ncbi:hypothetical protein B0F90DRAFT_1810874 [Multifurca ochricompacta]|uniref:RING-type domain-containing protein n=1 Tax=Multifurca ochricompacta TaxID=376703 RepID=A0AAD4QJV7_9AGAM|nr:hypothetical protein B0F90DRAFT_1810874 [Multifurca ochricompacta]